MRDIALTAFIFGSLPFILKRPQLGVIMYIWISVMNPHRLTWSFAYDMQFAMIVGLTTVIGALLSKDLRKPPANALMVSMIAFGLWTVISTIFALYPELSFERWKALMKTMLVASFIPMLFHRKEDLRLLVWVIVLSIGYYGTKGGVWTLLTGGVARVYGPMDSYIADNNAIAVAIVMVIPLMRYLQATSPHKAVRWGLVGMMIACAIAVLGSYSRGAFLAVFAMLAFLWWKGRHKIPVLLIFLVMIPFALTSMPEKWYERMQTISDYHLEGSAQMRLNSWATMLNIAKARPLTGGGFELAERAVYDRYSPDARFPPQVAHSIYFQALGEHGFVGLALYLSMLLALWLKAGKIVRLAQAKPELAWARDFAEMMRVTLIGFAVGGAFLSLVNFDVLYYLVALTAATLVLVERAASEKPVTDVPLEPSETRKARANETTIPVMR
jgi:probable O-glycosylation ligase (exosortase A-associated)